MLRGAQQPQRVMPVALERQHRVDHVLEDAWPGETAVLGDVTDHHDGDAAPLGLDHQPVRARPHLHDASGWGPEHRIGDGLDAVDHHEVGADLVDGGDDVGHRGRRQQPQIGAHGAEPLGPQAHLLGALLGTHVQRGRRPPRQQLQEQRALADARLAAEQRDRPGDDATAEHPVELADARRLRPADLGVDIADQDWCRRSE